jgi:hypothetical protein
LRSREIGAVHGVGGFSGASLALAMAATLVSGTAAAATNGFFDAAPGWVKDIFGGVDQVDSSSAIQVGVIDDHIVYAAPWEDGGFCLNFGPGDRSGPAGLGCVPGDGRTNGGEILMSLEIGHDGSFVIGRVGAADATAVDLYLPGRGEPVTTPVREHGFFLVKIQAASITVLMADDVFVTSRSITATARNDSGATIARSDAPPALLRMTHVEGASASPPAT